MRAQKFVLRMIVEDFVWFANNQSSVCSPSSPLPCGGTGRGGTHVLPALLLHLQG